MRVVTDALVTVMGALATAAEAVKIEDKAGLGALETVTAEKEAVEGIPAVATDAS